MSKSLNRAFIKAYTKNGEDRERKAVRSQPGGVAVRTDSASGTIPPPHLGDSRRGSLEATPVTGRDGVLDAAAAVGAQQSDSNVGDPEARFDPAEEGVHRVASPSLFWNEAFATQVVSMAGGEGDALSNEGAFRVPNGAPEESPTRYDSSRRGQRKGSTRAHGGVGQGRVKPTPESTGRNALDPAPDLEPPAGPALSPESYRAAVEKLARRHGSRGSILRVDSPSQKQDRDQSIAFPAPDAPPDARDREADTARPGPGMKEDVLQMEQYLRQMKHRVFNPAWEVDSIPWPEVCTQLLRNHYETMDVIGRNLRQSCQDGLQVLGVTAPRRGMGASTVACCLAMLAGVYGMKVALIDADLETPTLAAQTNLDIEIDWKTALLRDLTVEDAAVHSIDDQVTLIPLLAPVTALELDVFDLRIIRMFEQLVDGFDLVVVDVGNMESDRSLMTSLGREGMIHAVATVVDRRGAESRHIDACIRRIQRCGVRSIGLVENFAA